jgi:hypothetical protein
MSRTKVWCGKCRDWRFCTDIENIEYYEGFEGDMGSFKCPICEEWRVSKVRVDTTE